MEAHHDGHAVAADTCLELVRREIDRIRTEYRRMSAYGRIEANAILDTLTRIEAEAEGL